MSQENKKDITFSSKQEECISAKDNNYLISAGAGSGKTAVLTERIYRLAKAENTLDCFLVLTFTNLAAAEMKNRVRNALLKDDDTLHLATEVDNSHIETFDSFSLFLVKKYFYELGVCQNPNIVDKSVLTIKRKEILDEVFTRLYQAYDPDFAKLIYAYSIKTDANIRNFIIAILLESDRKEDKYSYLKDLRDNYFNDEKVNEVIDAIYQELVENMEFVRTSVYKLEDGNDANNICDFIDSLEEAKNYDELYAKLINSKFPTKPRSEATDVDYRKSIADFFNALKKRNYGTSDDIRRIYLNLKPYASKILDIAIEVEEKLDAFKNENNAYSFGDISRLVLKLLNNEDIRKDISDSFKYIMVDEYQDTNDIQETVINAISKNNVYMVGDVKQSIYRFRGADCSIFQDKYDNYKKGVGGKEIDLNTSYRSREEVVNFVNEVFEQVMRKDINKIDYQNGHHFDFGAKYYNNPQNCSYRPEVYDYLYEKSEEIMPKEAEIIASDILNRKHSGFQVYDKNLKTTRNCDFKDFAVIIDRSTNFDIVRKKFAELNIPLKVESKDTLFKSDIISVIKSLVRLLKCALNNDYESEEYIHAFFSVARSFLYQYDDKKLYEIHVNKEYLNEPFAQIIELNKESLRYASIRTILETIYEQFDIYSKVSRISSYYANVHKLESFLKIAESMDLLRYTLQDFVTYFDDLAKEDIDMDFKDSDTQENSVTLLTIHGSKGLEYGIIYFPGLNKEFNRPDLKSSYLISNKYGITLPSTEDSEFFSPFNHLIVEESKRADFEEKIRLLYVAITRAKEKIIILNGSKDKAEKNLIKPVDAKCMKDILNLTDVLTKYRSSYSSNYVMATNDNKDKATNKVIIDKIEVEAKEVVKNKASKELKDDVDESLLDFGTELHSYLEHMDLESDDLSYIKDIRMRKYVKNVKDSILFKGIRNDQVRHEYRYYDEENNVNGYIDALIIKDDEIDIVDFKLKNIDDEEYDKQLRTYKRYISKITTLPIRMFLLAALTGEIREVFDE